MVFIVENNISTHLTPDRLEPKAILCLYNDYILKMNYLIVRILETLEKTVFAMIRLLILKANRKHQHGSADTNAKESVV